MKSLCNFLTVNEDGTPLFGYPYLGVTALVLALGYLLWCCCGPL